MADLLLDLLSNAPAAALPPSGPVSRRGVLPPSPRKAKTKARADPTSLQYLTDLASKPLAALEAHEAQDLAHESHALLLSVQALANRSHKQIIQSATHHAALHAYLPGLGHSAAELRAAIPRLDAEAARFAESYNRSTSATAADSPTGEALARRKRALLLSRNVERLVDVLELPTLLSSAIGSASSPNNASAAAAGVQNTYSSALDLNGHIRRLHSLYPASPLVTSIVGQADDAMRAMAASLVLSLKTPNLKLANSLRTVSWLRRVLPDLLLDVVEPGISTGGGLGHPGTTTTTTTTAATAGGKAGYDDAQERLLGAMFLVCRLATLVNMLHALEPLRALADQELARQNSLAKAAAESGAAANAWSGGQQTERFLKRYIEIFREQSFAIVSMFRSIFPASTGSAATTTTTTLAAHTPDAVQALGPGTGTGTHSDPKAHQDDAQGPDASLLLQPMPSAMATFPLHLVEMLLETLRTYLPAVRDQASRDSLLTQVLYCAGSLGRLGGDFGLFLATLDVGASADEEWAEVVRRHRLLAGRLESIAIVKPSLKDGVSV